MKTILALLSALLLASPAHARDGFDKNGRPLVCDPKEWHEGDKDAGFKRCQEWIYGVKQPHSSTRCCGDADAYIADSFKRARDGSWVAIITRDYPQLEVDDGEGGTESVPGVPAGTEIPIPTDKLDDEHKGNPTGHGILFLNFKRDSTPNVLCYFTPELA